MQCFKCLEVGHLARKCPTAGGGRSVAARPDSESMDANVGQVGRPHSNGSGSSGSGASRDPVVEAVPSSKNYRPAGTASGQGTVRRNGGDTGGRGGPGRELYVPANEEPEEELYRHGVSSGINFSRYESIEVNMTGADVLAKVNTFEEANLHSLVVRNIRKSNYSCPTPVQKNAIPNIKEGYFVHFALLRKGE